MKTKEKLIQELYNLELAKLVMEYEILRTKVLIGLCLVGSAFACIPLIALLF